MPIELFGFSLGKKGKESPKPTSTETREGLKVQSFVQPDEYDGSFALDAGGIWGTNVNFDGAIRSENELMTRYRSMAIYPEVDNAVTDIVNDSIVIDDEKEPISLDLEKVKLSASIKNKIQDEFDTIIKLTNFNNKGSELFRRWYVDSKLYFHIVLDDNPKKGIKELRPIDPIKIKKIKKVEKTPVRKGNLSFPMVTNVEEYYLYVDTDKNSLYPTTSAGLQIALDSICYTHSGVIDSRTKMVVGYLQKAIRPLNMLRQIEDAVVIYRMSRAPERRIFYVDVGNLPKQKAEQYLRDIMNRYRQKVTYNPTTGEIADDRSHMSMLEDFWLPRREGGRGTEITTLDGGQNLGEMEDVEYFTKKLYRALGVPISRLEPDNGFNMGRSAEISRDEVKFFKFIDRLRQRFADLFLTLLRTQLITKGIMKQED